LLGAPQQVLSFGIPLARKALRFVAYGAIVFGAIAGGILYLNAGQLSDLNLGPIPKGTPVNLIANINPEADPIELKRAIKTTIAGLAEIKSRHLNEIEQQTLMRETIAPALLSVSKCPDFVMDRGHYFEWFDGMTDADKDALIELLKTF